MEDTALNVTLNVTHNKENYFKELGTLGDIGDILEATIKKILDCMRYCRMVNALIDNTLHEIALEYHPGTLVRLKRTRPKEFEKMKAIEKEINRLALGGDLGGLKKALSDYKELILTGLERIVEVKEWTNY